MKELGEKDISMPDTRRYALAARPRKGFVLRTPRLAFSFLAVIALGVTACSGGDIAEQIIESQEGVGDVEIDEDSGQIEVETDDGSVVIGGGDIPDGFPIDVPGGGEVLAVFEQDDEASVSINYNDDYDDIAGFFENWIDSQGAEVINEFTSTTPRSASWSLQDGDRVYSITVADLGDGGVQATLIVGDA